MSDIVLKDASGSDVTYNSVSSVTFNTPGGGIATYSEGGVSVQADYEQNNETASDYIKNRPFYDTQIIFDKKLKLKNVTSNDDDSSLPEGVHYHMANSSGNVKLEANKEYNYVIDYGAEQKYVGNDYTESYTVDDTTVLILGNGDKYRKYCLGDTSVEISNICEYTIVCEPSSVNYNILVLRWDDSEDTDEYQIRVKIQDPNGTFKAIESKFLCGNKCRTMTSIDAYATFEPNMMQPIATVTPIPDTYAQYMRLYKISNRILPLTLNKLNGLTATYNDGSKDQIFEYSIDDEETKIAYSDDVGFIFQCGEMYIINVQTPGTFCYQNVDLATFNETGIYVSGPIDYSDFAVQTLIIGIKTYDKLTKEYVPEVSWGDVKNKPFGEIYEIASLDKNVEELLNDPNTINMNDNCYLVKVSDETIGIDELSRCTFTSMVQYNVHTSDFEMNETMLGNSAQMDTRYSGGPVQINESDGIIKLLCFPECVVIVITADSASQEGITLTKGIYFSIQSYSEGGTRATMWAESIISPTPLVKKLNAKYVDVSWDNLEDRPFGEVSTYNVILAAENQNFTAQSDGTGTGKLLTSYESIQVGNEYTVVLDGVEYIRTAYTITKGEATYVCLGNRYKIETKFDITPTVEDSEDILGIVFYAGDEGHLVTAYVFGETETTTHSITVSEGSNGIKKLNPKYLPDISALAGEDARPTYNGSAMALLSDIEKLLNYRTVTLNLTDCSVDNTTTKVIDGQSYAATVSVNTNDGYTLNGAEVAIMMGDVDVTSKYYKNGVIAIPNVTSNLEITITAAVANLIDIYGISEVGTRASMSSGANTTGALDSYVVGATMDENGIIPISPGDIFYIYGATWTSSSDTDIGYVIYTSCDNSTSVSGSNHLYKDNGSITLYTSTDTSDIYIISPSSNSDISEGMGIRFSLRATDGSKIVITKNTPPNIE